MTTEELLRSTLRPPIAVVGNGPLGDWGAVIDAYASVIRINQFTTRGFELSSGAKTTHWCVRFHVELPAVRPHDLVPFTPYARTESRTWGHRTDLIFAGTSVTVHLKKRAPDLLVRRLWFIRDYHMETTGFALTVLLLELGFRPTLFGFDGLQTGHYFNPDHRHWEGHKRTGREMDYFREWGVLYVPSRTAAT